MQRLQKVLNFALRTVSGRRKFDHISDVREELGWPTDRQLYEQYSLNFLHKIRCTGEPEALSSQLQVNSTLRSRSTRQDADLALPRVRTEAGRRRLLFRVNFLHKIRCTGEPEALSSQLQVNSTLRSRSTRQDADLALPRVRTEAGRRRLLFRVVQSYNRLPLEIRDLSLKSFKREVLQYLDM